MDYGCPGRRLLVGAAVEAPGPVMQTLTAPQNSKVNSDTKLKDTIIKTRRKTRSVKTAVPAPKEQQFWDAQAEVV